MVHTYINTYVPRVGLRREADAARANGGAGDKQPLPAQRSLQADVHRPEAGPLRRQLGAAPVEDKQQRDSDFQPVWSVGRK